MTLRESVDDFVDYLADSLSRRFNRQVTRREASRVFAFTLNRVFVVDEILDACAQIYRDEFDRK